MIKYRPLSSVIRFKYKSAISHKNTSIIFIFDLQVQSDKQNKKKNKKKKAFLTIFPSVHKLFWKIKTRFTKIWTTKKKTRRTRQFNLNYSYWLMSLKLTSTISRMINDKKIECLIKVYKIEMKSLNFSRSQITKRERKKFLKT